MLNKIQKTVSGEKGFTLIELLVVVAIIGILVAIAIPQFASYKVRANNSTCQADLRNLATAMEAWYVDNTTYAGASPAVAGNLQTSYGYGQTQLAAAAACTVAIVTQTATAWTATSVWATGNAGDGTMTYTWNSALGGMQPPVAL